MDESTVLKWINGEEFVVSLGAGISASSVRAELAGACNTYGGELAERIVAAFFNGLVDLRHEYAAYYSTEYATVEMFLCRMYGLSAADAEALAGHRGQLLGWGTLVCGGDDILSQWVEYGGGRQIVMCVLRCTKDANENSD